MAEREVRMGFFGQAIEKLKVLVIALGAGLGVWGIINLLEGYGADFIRVKMLMCGKVSHTDLIDSSLLFRNFIT